MTTIAHPTHPPVTVRPLCGILCALMFLSAGAATARAQSDYASTPAALAPGSPAGSYHLSDIDTVNLFNGSVNVTLPLTGISGRGGAKGVAALSWTSPARWQIVKGYDAYGGAVYGPQVDPMSDSTGRLRLGNWRAYFSKSVDVVLPCGPNYEGIFYAQYTLARLHVVEPDGTDHELRDTATGGQPLPNGGCTSTGPSRGREFVSTDGSGITVLFDDVIRDGVQIDQPDVTGGGAGVWLLFPDGRRLRSTADSLTMRDRNGNMMTWEDHQGELSYPGMTILPGSFSSVRDSLGRRVTPGSAPVSECVARGGDPQGMCSYVSYKGFEGVERRIYIGTNGAYLTSHVFLPDGLSYRFYYNQYDDLRRIDLPTGGSIEYEYGPGLDGPQPTPDYRITNPLPGIYDGGPSDFHVYRRVTERRLYKEGHVLVNKQTFSKPEHTQNGNAGFVEKKVYDSNGTSLLSSEKHYFHGGANETFNIWQPFAHTPWKVGREYRTEFYGAGGNLLRAVEQAWQQRAPVSWWTGDPDAAPSNDPRVYQVTTTLENGLVSMTTYGYDANVPYNSQTDVQEYDYGVGGPGPMLRRTHTDFITDPSYTSALTGAYIRNLPWQQWVSTDVWGQNRVSHTNIGYDEFALADAPNITGHDPAYTVARTARGNQTSLTRYANASGLSGAVTTSTHYDIAGNVVSATDGLGNTAQISYADSFCNDGGARCAGTFTPYTYAYPTGMTSPVPDASASIGFPAGTFGSTSALAASTVYDFYTGLVYSTTDANGQTTKMEYGDPLGRPTAQVRPGPTGGRTDISYAADGRSVHVSSDLDGSRRLESYQYFDGLGRAVRSQRYENSDAAKPWITVDTEYDAFGRVKRTSSPYRWTVGASNQFSTNKWVEYTYDALNRVLTTATQPYGAVVHTDYSGDRVLVKDPAGKERLSRADALGRPTEVWEVTPEESGAEGSTVAITAFPGHPEAAHGYLTKYKYDTLGNLRMVEQEGRHLGQTVTQRRFFAYDSLGRLVRAKHPEQGNMTADADFPALTDSASGVNNSQWSVGYFYDANGNVIKRKDARTSTLGVTTTYAYDHLNRNIVTAYTTPAGSGAAATPEVRRYYDNAAAGANGLGRLYVTETMGVSYTAYDVYDPMGRPTQYRQVFGAGGAWGQPFNVGRTYDKAGNVLTQTYPSGHAVSYNYDAAGRPADNGSQAAFAGNLGDGTQRTYASEVRYHELGGMEQERFGTQTPVYNKSLFNSRGQLAEMRVSTYAITAAGHETDWNRGAIINHYSNAAGAWGASGGGADNNGNLLRQEVYVPNDDQISGYFNVVEHYGYDPLNRLTSVEEKPFNATTNFTQTYSYDRWGNRTVNAAGTTNAPAPQYTVSAATNRLAPPPGYAMTYDAAGNLTFDNYLGGQGGGGSRAYDAEGRMTSAQFLAGQTQTAAYTYDADGRRVKRGVGAAGEVWQVYGMGGELLAEYAPGATPTQPQKEYGYRGGELLVTAEPGSSSGGGPSSGLLGHWKFDEGAGSSAADSSGGAHPGALQGGAGWAAGASGSAVALDGADDFVQMGANGFAVSSGLTLSAWVYPTGSGSGGANGGIVVNKEGEYEIARFPDGTIQVAFANTTPGWDWINTGFVAPLNQWTHLTVTYDNGAVKTYANGQLVHTYAGTGAIGDVNPAQNDFRVGGRQAGAHNFAGRLDEVRVYDRALTQAEAGALAGPSPAGLAGHWKFDEGAGATATDASGGANTGTLQAGAGWGAGQAGTAAALDGVDDYVQVGAQPSLAVTNGLTVSAWVYPTGAGSLATYGGIIVNKEGEYELGRFQDGTIRWAIANQSPGWDWVNTGYVAPLNQWTHITFTYDGVAGKTYANGQLVHTAAATGAIGDTNTAQNDLRVGGRQAISQNFAGRLDEVRVYNRALAAHETSALWAAGQPQGGGASVRWLVSDHLGTPRMVIDQTGSLAGVRRHDYLPFGEEVPGDLSWRTAARGYAGDPVRQKFTSKERDEETHLDYFLARYYSYQQGRFTSVDTFGPWAMSEGEKATFMSDPQQWNRYSYVTNNPLRYTDPDGLLRFDQSVSEEQQEIILRALNSILKHGNEKQKAIANFLLTNDVTVSIETNAGKGFRGKADFTGDDEGYGPTQQAIDSGPLTMSQAAGLVSIKLLANEVKAGAIDSVKLEGMLVHEGKHAHDLARVAQGLSDPTGPNAGFDPTQFTFERAAFVAQAEYYKNSNVGQQLGRHLGILELIPREGRLPELGVNEIGIRKILISDSYSYRVTVHEPGDTRSKATGLKPRQPK